MAVSTYVISIPMSYRLVISTQSAQWESLYCTFEAANLRGMSLHHGVLSVKCRGKLVLCLSVNIAEIKLALSDAWL